MEFVSSRGCESATKDGGTHRHTYLYPTQLWFGTAHSVVVYIVPVFKKNILFFPPFFYILIPPGTGWDSMTLHNPDSRTTQGAWCPVMLGPLVRTCRLPVLCGSGGCPSPVSQALSGAVGWPALPVSTALPALDPRGERPHRRRQDHPDSVELRLTAWHRQCTRGRVA